jgi:protein-tyrosine phosphatase
MDGQNLRDLQRLRPADATARLELLGAHDPQGVREVADPYYDGPEAFTAMHAHVERCCRALG